MAHRHTSLGDVERAHSNFSTIEQYWNDPEFRKRHDAERDKFREDTNKLIDEGIAKARRKRGLPE